MYVTFYKNHGKLLLLIGIAEKVCQLMQHGNEGTFSMWMLLFKVYSDKNV